MAGALNHSESTCPLGKGCGSKENTKLVETLFFSSDGKMAEITCEQIEAFLVDVLDWPSMSSDDEDDDSIAHQSSGVEVDVIEDEDVSGHRDPSCCFIA